jgi:hypothetical protein
MNKLNNYVPIMSLKLGELKAIKNLSQHAYKAFTPLFDIHRTPIAGGKRKSIDGHIEKIIINVEKYLTDKFFLLDYSLIDLNLRMKDNAHPFHYLLNQLSSRNINFTPTFGLDRDQAYLNVIKEFISKNPNNPICLRLLRDDIDTPQQTEIEINQIISHLQLNPKNCDLLVDCKYIEQDQIELIIDSLSELNEKINFRNWRSLTLAASSFPFDMTGIPADSHISIPRFEFDLWEAAILVSPLIGRKPKFADYCIVNPDRPDLDAITMRAGGKIRYTTKKTWEIFRGHGLHKGEKYGQYRSLSKKVIESQFFLGSDYSWGDNYITKCANGNAKTGNLTTWISVDVNHHITMVGEQISSSDALSNTD